MALYAFQGKVCSYSIAFEKNTSAIIIKHQCGGEQRYRNVCVCLLSWEYVGLRLFWIQAMSWMSMSSMPIWRPLHHKERSFLWKCIMYGYIRVKKNYKTSVKVDSIWCVPTLPSWSKQSGLTSSIETSFAKINLWWRALKNRAFKSMIIQCSSTIV